MSDILQNKDKGILSSKKPTCKVAVVVVDVVLAVVIVAELAVVVDVVLAVVVVAELAVVVDVVLAVVIVAELAVVVDVVLAVVIVAELVAVVVAELVAVAAAEVALAAIDLGATIVGANGACLSPFAFRYFFNLSFVASCGVK